MAVVDVDVPEVGQLVQVRGQQWVVSAIARSTQPVDELAASVPPGRTMVTLTSVSDEDLGDELRVVWEIEPGRRILPASDLPDVTTGDWDDPQRLGAFLDAVRWGTVASADTRTLQAPFRAGIRIEEYQLEPVAKALEMPRVNLLIADDVGLGKTIEAGLIVQELLLRHRARRVVVVCPASLTGKWQSEMADRFGLAFEILDTERLKGLRRTNGLEANPFTVFPRTIISLQWLRTPRIQRLLDEVLDPDTRHRGFFDLLIVDEAHHCAPPAPTRSKGYAVDSKQTRAVRRMDEHSHHRLFLSATPHNGYSESWQALLEMLDPQRFFRGVEPDPDVVRQVMVRRLKDDIVDADGAPRFPARITSAVEVRYRDDEQVGHQLLESYTASRRRQPGVVTGRLNDLVTLLLKKRLFSSPAAFHRTLGVHADSLRRAAGDRVGSRPSVIGTAHRTANRQADVDTELPEWLAEALEWDSEPSTEQEGEEGEEDLLLARAADLLGETDQRAAEGPTANGAAATLDELSLWAQRHAEAEDSKAKALIAMLERVCRPDGRWNDERVVVFTEYLDTLQWLAGILTARGLGGVRLGLLHGGMDPVARDHLKAAFQADPSRDPVRILLATDAASEGIDLQHHCHRLVNYDIPFNPNRLEQRIGRLDRFGQAHPIEVTHFVGAGWQEAPAGSFEADLEFLSRVAAKVAVERRDLGSVNPVLAAAVEARMLGGAVFADPTVVDPTPSTASLRAEHDLRRAAARLRDQLDSSKRRLHVAPANVRRVVDTALALAGQPPLEDLDGGRIAPPALRGGWERTVAGLPDPLDGTLRPLTFDADVAAIGDGVAGDVVLAHLEHPLVAQSTRLLRSAVWGGRLALHRVAGITYRPPDGLDTDGLLVAVFARLVVVGGDGARIHEEVILAGRHLPNTGRTRRVELDAARYADLRTAVEEALDPATCRVGPPGAAARLAAAWSELTPRLAEDLDRRATQQLEALERTITTRRQAEADRTAAIFDQLETTLRRALEGPGAQQLSFDDLDVASRQQIARDRRAWQDRLDGVADARRRELAVVERRFAGIRHLVFPIAVVCASPQP
ncbi:MAG: DISARM system SNF2-like helicase DrmD [Actinomycetota bacterium]|nr:DISARM system SNF2-like helicase DrmD [Actinomycetota bacterium]